MSTPVPTPASELARNATEAATSACLGRLVLAGVPIGPAQRELVENIVRSTFGWLGERAEQGDAGEEFKAALIAAVAVDQSIGHYDSNGLT